MNLTSVEVQALGHHSSCPLHAYSSAGWQSHALSGNLQ